MLPPGRWLPLAADASTRRYFKGEWWGAPALLAQFGGDRDGLERFVHVRNLFAGGGLDVPEILHVPPEDPDWLIESWVEGWALSRGRWRPEWGDRLLSSARVISSLQDWGEGPDLLELDRARLQFELSFFSVHLLEGFLNISVSPSVSVGLSVLAEEVGGYPRRLAHRDLHSENVLATAQGRLVLLDFQDALLAPRCYDAASLAVDAYRDQRPAIRDLFAEGWSGEAGVAAEEFGRTALQRALKALGTFGYQVTRRKKARYLKFMAAEARHALHFLPLAPAPLEELAPPLQSLTELG
ncbi:MAG: phosphotransferase [Acidobacteriota bacterium]